MEATLLCVAYAISIALGAVFLYFGNRILKYYHVDPRLSLDKSVFPIAYSVAGTAYGLLLSYIVYALYTLTQIQITLLRGLAWIGIVAVILFLVPALAGEVFQSPEKPDGLSITDFLYASAGILLGSIAFVVAILTRSA